MLKLVLLALVLIKAAPKQAPLAVVVTLGARADVLIGACAAAASVCLMIPLDTVKVRMTTGNLGGVAYRNVADAIRTMLREEGAFCFYRGLPPRCSASTTA